MDFLQSFICSRITVFTRIVVLGAAFAVFGGCASKPEAAVEPNAPVPTDDVAAAVDKLEDAVSASDTVPASDDVWKALRSGDSAKAKAFFIGDVDVKAVNPETGMTPLHYAAANNDAPLAAFFIFMGADVNALDKQGRTPLMISVSNTGDTAEQGRTTSALVYGKSDIFQAMPNGSTPGALALTKPTVLKGMIETPAVITQNNKEGRNLLDLALARPDSKAHMTAAEILIRAGAYSSAPLFSYLAPAVRSSNYNLRIGDGITPLHYAARAGYTGLTAFLLEKDADVNAKTAAGSTPLHEAAMTGSIDCMRMLIEAGADVNAQDAKGNSVLHIAAPPAVHAQVVQLLLEGKVNPNLRDEYGETPLHILIALGRDVSIISALLEGGADVSIRNIDGKTPLYLAVEDNKPDYIQPLLARNADVFAADNNNLTPFELTLSNPALLPLIITDKTVLQSDGAGNTMLHIAVSRGAGLEIITAILDKGAVVDARNKAGDTALNLAARLNNEPVGTLLLSRNADIFAANAKGESPLYSAFFSPDRNIRQWMLTPQTLSARDGLGNTALHYAAQWGLDAQIPLMVSLGSDIEARNATGETPLFTAVKYDAPTTIDALLGAGASIDQRDRIGNTALHAAVRWNAPEAGRTLIQRGVDVNAHALNGETALHSAVRTGNSDMELLLTRNGADIDARDAEGNTPLMEAIAGGFSAPAERLAALGADAGTRNMAGNTPLHLAVNMGRTDLAGALLKLGASIHARNARGETPFRIALVTSPAMVSLLLADSRVLLADDNGLSPLHIAIRDKAPLPMIQAIVAGKAKLSAIDAEGKIPLRLAVDLDEWDAARLLVEAGSDVFSEAGDGKSPAIVALEKGANAVDALFSGTAALTAVDRAGNTILHIAAQYGTLDELHQLIASGADKTAKNISGETPADAAARWKRTDIESALR